MEAVMALVSWVQVGELHESATVKPTSNLTSICPAQHHRANENFLRGVVAVELGKDSFRSTRDRISSVVELWRNIIIL